MSQGFARSRGGDILASQVQPGTFGGSTGYTFPAAVTVDAALASSNDSGALGASGAAFSDLFLASGAVIYFNAGDMTVTHSANTLTVAGGTFATAALTATTITGSGILSIDDTTNTSSGTTGSIHTDGGLGVAFALYVAGGSTVVGASVGADVGTFTTADTATDTDIVVFQRLGAAVRGAIHFVTASNFLGIGTTTAHSFTIFTGGTDAITVNSSQDITLAGDLTVSGTGPHVVGGATLDYSRIRFTGNYTSGGAATQAEAFRVDGALTGASGDTTFLAHVFIEPAIVTQTATESIGVISSLRVVEPNITDNLTGDITVAATLYIVSAPTEGEDNYLVGTGVAGCFCTAAGVWTDASARQHKKNIDAIPLPEAADVLRQIPIRKFERRVNDRAGWTEVGVIADELPSLVVPPHADGVAAIRLASLSIAGWQEHDAKIRSLELENAKLHEEIELLKAA